MAAWKDWFLPLVQDVTFHLVQLFSKHATRFEVQHTLIAGAGEEQVGTNCKIQCSRHFEITRSEFKWKQQRCVALCLPVVDYLHCSILLDPQLPQDDVVHAAHWVCPRVCFFMSARVLKKVHWVGGKQLLRARLSILSMEIFFFFSKLSCKTVLVESQGGLRPTS